MQLESLRSPVRSWCSLHFLAIGIAGLNRLRPFPALHVSGVWNAPIPALSSDSYLSFCEAQPVGQLLPLGSHHIVVLVEGALQPQQLRGGEGGANALGLAGERAMQEQAVRAAVLT